MQNGTHYRIREAATGCLMLITILGFSAMAPGTGLAQLCEVPLFVQQGTAQANIMVLVDNSGSMNAAMYDDGYDPGVIYAGSFTSETIYTVDASGSYTPQSFNGSWAPAPAAALVTSDNGMPGQYTGNYLNYIYFQLDAVQRANIPQVTRIQVLKEVLVPLINRSEQMRMGLTRFNYDQGGTVVAPCGASEAVLRNEIANLTANTWTPLAESMETIADYFSDSGPNAPIESSCQKSFIIVVTDGLPTYDVDVSSYLQDQDEDHDDPGNCTSIGAPYPNSYDCSDHFDDVAEYLHHADIRPDLAGEQHLKTYVIGFNENGRLLQDAADNGDGLFFNASNAVELSQSLEYAVLDILQKISAGGAVAVTSTESGTNDRIYRAKLAPLDWQGFLECYALPYNKKAPPIWEAASLINARTKSSRNIFTALGTNRMNFDTGYASDLWSSMGVASSAEASDLISWGRGNPVAGLRNRHNWYLGDIVHSSPIVIGPPGGFNATPEFQAFADANANRRPVVYVGANDGMFHAFDADTGDELWAFVPEFALPVFAAMADSGYCHRYSVDLTATVKDIQVDGTWRTMLVSGGGQGSAAIFAMDVTDPDNPLLQWQANLPNGMKFHSEVEVVSIGGTAVALVGSGLDETTGESWLYSYDLVTGAELGRVLLGANATVRNKATKPATVDLNMDDEIDVVYAADMLGQVLRFDTGGQPNPAYWHSTVLYSGNQEITANPVAAYGPNGAVYVYFGTGAFLNTADILTVDQQSFICVFDEHTGNTIYKADLTNQTTLVNNVAIGQGWYVDLWSQTGERVTEPAVVVAETVIFTSYTPFKPHHENHDGNENEVHCKSKGESQIYQMNYATGGLPANPMTGEDDDDHDGDGDDHEVSRTQELEHGIASRPVVDLVTGTVSVQTTRARIEIVPLAGNFAQMSVRSWQEDFDGVIPPQ